MAQLAQQSSYTIASIEPEKPLMSDERPRDYSLSRQAYQTLHVGFAAVPIIAGLDKFFHLLVNWDQYLAPQAQRILGSNSHTFMLIVGVIEIVAGIGVALKPRIFGYVVSAWLVGIVVNLLMSGQYFDIALRDLGLSIGAFALARLSHVFDPGPGLRRIA